MVGDTNEYYEVQIPYGGQEECWSKYCSFSVDRLEEAKDCARKLAGLDGIRVRLVRVQAFVEFEVM